IKSYSVKLDLRDAKQLREKALGNTMEGIYVGMISSCNELVGELFEEGSTMNSRKYDNLLDLQDASDSEDAWPDNEHQSVMSLDSPNQSNSELEYVDKLSTSSPRASLNKCVNCNWEGLQDQDPSGDGYFKDIVLSLDQDFGEDAYDFVVTHPKQRVVLVWEEEKKFGRPRYLGSAPAHKLDFFLESWQPYPGDPANVLQYKG
ncbi:hypothetical protein C0995_010303, partial [Termitomyces sp. Mi166